MYLFYLLHHNILKAVLLPFFNSLKYNKIMLVITIFNILLNILKQLYYIYTIH